ncbi:MAG TPA: hypothetical protein VMW43_09455 [Bacteroidota bacterium]|nr:hypothetical protein [Bacteroidota bacterium]
MKHYFQFLFRLVDHDRTMALKFYDELVATLPQCSPQAEVNLYAPAEEEGRSMSEQLESCFIECTDSALPILKHLLRSYPAVEIPSPPETEPALLLGTGTPCYVRR